MVEAVTLRELGIGLGAAGLGAVLARHCFQTTAGTATSEVHVNTAGALGVGTQLPMMKQKTHGDAIYLDWNATSPIFPEVTEEMLPYTGLRFGNPSSGHAFGRPCAAAVATARERVAALVHCQTSEIIFTSCGSESDNHAIRIAVERGRARLPTGVTPHIVTTNIEHPAIEACLCALEYSGAVEVTRIGVDMEGLVAVGDVRDAVRPDQTVLVTIMHSNNEVGSVQPIKRIVKAVKFCSKKIEGSPRTGAAAEHLCLVHTDAAQSIGKVVVDVADLGVDMATVVGHKFGCPKGVAALFVKVGTPFVPMFFGGGQEGGRRAGTENVLLIAAIGKAAEVVKDEADEIAAHMTAMRERLLHRLIDGMGADAIRTNGPVDPAKRLPNTLSVGIKGASATSLLAALSEKVAASASAACHTGGQQEVSAILRAMKVPQEFALGTLRLSVGRHTTPDEIDLAASLIVSEAKKQR